ncbi:hypothetical protein HMI54_012365, partial [Coelomomyces lativittatus]
AVPQDVLAVRQQHGEAGQHGSPAPEIKQGIRHLLRRCQSPSREREPRSRILSHQAHATCVQVSAAHSRTRQIFVAIGSGLRETSGGARHGDQSGGARELDESSRRKDRQDASNPVSSRWGKIFLIIIYIFSLMEEKPNALTFRLLSG